MSKFKSWDEWHKAFRKVLEENGIKGNLHGIGDDGIFFVFDYSCQKTLWTFDWYGQLKKYEMVEA